MTWLLASSFGAYFALILYCDLNRPEAFGAEVRAASGRLVVHSVDDTSPAARAGLRPGDRIITFGERPLRGPLDWNAAIANIELDRDIPLKFERGTATLSTALVLHPGAARWWRSPGGVSQLLLRAVQLVTLLVAIAIAVKATDVTGQLGACFLATIGVYCLALPYRLATVWRVVPFGAALLFWIPLISTLVIGGTLFAFFASFPRARYSGTRLLLLCSPLVLVVAWEARFIGALVYRSEDVSAVPDLMPWIVAINGAYAAAGVVALLRNYRMLDAPNERRRIRLVVAGSCLGSAAGVAPVLTYWLGLGSNLSGMYEPSPLLLIASAGFVTMPISFWHAIVRHQLFDLRLIARRGLSYAFARRALLAGGPLIITAMAIDAVWHRHESIGGLVRGHFLWYVVAITTLGALQFWREPCLNYLDRRLFRDRYNACAVLRAVASQVRVAGALRAVAPSIVEQIASALHPQWIALFIRARDDEFFHAVASLPAVVGPWPARTRLLDFVRALQKPLDVDLPDAEWVVEHLPDADVDRLGDTGAHLIVPVVMDASAAEAMIVLGRKRSDEPFDREDKDLLQGIAESLSTLIQPYVASLTSSPAPADETVEVALAPEAAGRVDRLAAAVSMGASVEWEAEASTVSSELEKRMLDELRVLAHIGDVHRRSHSASDASPTRWGPFHLRETVGRGSFGTVYRAWDPKLDRDVAVKLLQRQPVAARSRFDEGRLLARVRHPNVVTVYGADEIDGIAGVWMEFVHGRTIKALIQEQGVFGGHEAALVGAIVSRALAAVHRAGLLHQDVKAQNVMREHGGRLVLMDFGAGVVSQESVMPSGGTPIYMAPELFAAAAASPQSDVYAVGVLLFHMVTGAFPVEGRTYAELRHHHALGARQWLRDLRPDLPDRFVAAVERALDADPSRRFASAGAFELALAAGDL